MWDIRNLFRGSWIADDTNPQLSRLDWWDKYPHLAPRSANDLARVDVKRTAKFLTTAPLDEVEASRSRGVLLDYSQQDQQTVMRWA